MVPPAAASASSDSHLASSKQTARPLEGSGGAERRQGANSGGAQDRHGTDGAERAHFARGIHACSAVGLATRSTGMGAP